MFFRAANAITTVSAPPTGSFVLLDQVRKVTLAAVIAVEVHRHEHARTTDLVGTLLAQALHLVVAVNLVELQHSELDFLLLCLIFLGLVYVFFLRFLPPPSKSRDRKTVESVVIPHAPMSSEHPRERPPKMRRCSSAGMPCDAAICAFRPATSDAGSAVTTLDLPARSRTKNCILLADKRSHARKTGPNWLE